jgi:AcrR family transcriptional regulator
MDGHRRERILTAARRLLNGEADGRRLTVGGVAAAAHVSRATVYRYFPDKATLLRAAGAANGARPTPVEPRARILEAALDVFGERGIHAATLGEIASRAGLSLSGLHWHFKNKEELVAAIGQYVPLFPTIAAEALQAEAGDTDLEAQLTRIADVILDVAERRRGLLRFVIFETGVYPDVARLASTHTVGRFLPLLAELFERHARRGTLRPGSARARAQAFMGMFALLALLRPAFDPILAPDDRETAREYIGIMLCGIRAAPEGS